MSLVEAAGVEPASSRVRTGCSAQLSYASLDWGDRRDLNPILRVHSAVLSPVELRPPYSCCRFVAEREGVEPSSVGFGDPGPRRRALFEMDGDRGIEPRTVGLRTRRAACCASPHSVSCFARLDWPEAQAEVRVSSTVPTARTRSARRSEGREPDVTGGSSRNRTLRGESRRGYSPARLHSDLTILDFCFLLVEPRAGIEPARTGVAIPRLPIWRPRR